MQAGSAHAKQYTSSLDGLLTIIRHEGVAGLYKGIESKLVQSVLTAAILFLGQKRIYEMLKKVSFPSFVDSVEQNLLIFISFGLVSLGADCSLICMKMGSSPLTRCKELALDSCGMQSV